jgi:hypothetical protein
MRAFVICFCLFLAAGAQAATYQWTDNKGVVHFSDDPDRIPAQYQKKARRLDGDDGPAPATAAPRAAEPAEPAAPVPAGAAGDFYCGKSAASWIGQFKSLREERRALAAALPEKEKELQRKRTKYLSRTGRGAGYYQQKKEYLALSDEYGKAKARLEELDGQLASLDAEASRCALPLEFRQ